MLITALLPIDLNAIVFRDVGLFVLRSLVFTVSLSIVTAYSWLAWSGPVSGPAFSVTLSPIQCAMTVHRSTQKYGRGRNREQVGRKEEAGTDD